MEATLLIILSYTLYVNYIANFDRNLYKEFIVGPGILKSN